MLAAGVFLGGRLTAAPNAFVPSTSLLESDSIADGLSRRMSSPPHVVFRSLIDGKVVEVVKVLTGGRPVDLKCLQGGLLGLRMRVAERDWSERLHR